LSLIGAHELDRRGRVAPPLVLGRLGRHRNGFAKKLILLNDVRSRSTGPHVGTVLQEGDLTESFEVGTLLERIQRDRKAYHEFLRVPTMSAGLYVLPRGGKDLQAPHTEDEIYFIVGGRARIRLGSGDRDVERGSIIFVPARVEHRFHSIAEELTALVFFAPAEGSAGGPS